MRDTRKTRPSVPGSKLILGQGSDQEIQQTEGAKNPRVRSGYHGRQQMYIATYNVRTLSSEEKLLELKEELKYIKWDVMGLCEVRREEEDCITLKSGHQLFYMGNKEKIEGLGLLIHKRHTKNIPQLKGINPRIILCILQLNKKKQP
ncbi:uncharacterized protein [Diabrotica undecimpunctata]|uniref:uncharacterized protein n=1 Tax=Diabrotica undecimpunctata TaxID=50387 RepID=UPI003B632E3B